MLLWRTFVPLIAHVSAPIHVEGKANSEGCGWTMIVALALPGAGKKVGVYAVQFWNGLNG